MAYDNFPSKDPAILRMQLVSGCLSMTVGPRERKPRSLGLCEFAHSSVKEVLLQAWLELFNLNRLVSFSISKQLSEYTILLTGLRSIYSVDESVTGKSKICGCQFQNFRVAQRSIRSSFGQEDKLTVFHLL